MQNDVFLQRAGRIAGVGGWRLDLKTNVLDWSDQTCQILGYPNGYQPALTEAFDLHPEQDRIFIENVVNDAILNRRSFDVELQIRTRTGTLKWVRSFGEIEYEDGMAVALAGAFQDISERKINEAKIAQSLEDTKQFYDNAPCGYYSLGPDRTFLRANDRLLSWLGCAREDIIGKKKPTELMTPDSLAPAIAAFEVLREKGEVNGLECELLPVNGFSRHVSISATAHYDKDGSFVSTTSVMYDITELVKYRQQVENLSKDMLAMVDNNLIGTIVVKDRIIVWANKAMHRIFGYDEGELIGQSAEIGYKDLESYERVRESAYPMLLAGSTYKSELEMIRKDREPVWISFHGMNLQNRPGHTMWMMADVSELKRQSSQAEYLATHDAATGLSNRRGFEVLAKASLAQAKLTGTKTAICFLDLDGFKAVNDTFGHEAGDKLIVTIAERLKDAVRQHDEVCRMGGDEFVLILNNVNDVDDIDKILTRVCAQINAPVFFSSEASAQVSASIGVSLFPDDSLEKGILLRQADHAMYSAKSSGKNQIVKFAKISEPAHFGNGAG